MSRRKEKQKRMADNDFKYVLQDFSNIYIGARSSYGELADETGMSLFDLKEAVDLSGDAIEDIDSKGEN